jgi:hypothetical protein
MVIIVEIMIILISQFNSLLTIPNLNKYLFDYYLIFEKKSQLIIYYVALGGY